MKIEPGTARKLICIFAAAVRPGGRCVTVADGAQRAVVKSSLKTAMRAVSNDSCAPGPEVHQVVYMDDVPRTGVPVLDLVQRVRVTENTKGVDLAWERDNDFTVRLNKSGSRRLNYEAWSEVGDPSADVLRQIPFDFTSVNEADLDTLTLSPLSEQTIAMATAIAEGQPTLYDKVAATEAYLSGPDFLYSLDNQATTAVSIIDDFVLNTRRGHCEKFATAMALMVRSQGIPARVVSGFRGGEWNESDRSYTIRASIPKEASRLKLRK